VAFGSLITGIQTMPSIAWFPLAILLFQLSERAIMFVVVIGAAPSIANGLISGSDNIPPVLLRAGRALGARGFSSYRHIVLPASLPYFVGGMKQGWAFAWRSLMAGELLVVIAGRESIGVLLQTNRNLQNADGLLAVMIAILVIGHPRGQPGLRDPGSGHPSPLGPPRPRRLSLGSAVLGAAAGAGAAGPGTSVQVVGGHEPGHGGTAGQEEHAEAGALGQVAKRQGRAQRVGPIGQR